MEFRNPNVHTSQYGSSVCKCCNLYKCIVSCLSLCEGFWETVALKIAVHDIHVLLLRFSELRIFLVNITNMYSFTYERGIYVIKKYIYIFIKTLLSYFAFFKVTGSDMAGGIKL
jgi:hypothetical protein